MTYLTLDDLDIYSRARTDPQGFLAELRGPLILDEVQRAPELFLPLKAAIDRDRTPGRYLLTGSATPGFFPELSQALVGRMAQQTLLPLSQGELEGRQGSFFSWIFSGEPPPKASQLSEPCGPAVLAAALKGGFPPACAAGSQKRAGAWLGQYLNTLLSKELRELGELKHLHALPALVTHLALRTGSPLNQAGLASACGLKLPTLRNYLARFMGVYLASPLLPWSAARTARLVRSPKFYLIDPGLYASAVGYQSGRPDMETLKGALVETLVHGELQRQATWHDAPPSFYFFRTHTGKEVDFLLEEKSGRMAGIEVKAGANVSPSDFAGLRLLQEELGKRFMGGVVLYLGQSAVPFGKGMWALPLTALWNI